MTTTLEPQDYVRVSGPDTLKFLQGQVSCDMDSLTATRSLRGALCNLKGRVVADFRALPCPDEEDPSRGWNGTDVLLQTAAGMAEPIVATLSKYAVFSKVTLTQVSEPPPSLGFIGSDCEAPLTTHVGALPPELDDCLPTQDGLLVRTGRHAPRFELIPNTANAIPELASIKPTPPPLWHWQTTQEGEFHVTPATSEAFTPQLLNYDLSGVIDFNKGCYTGQEVVARMYYRGKPKQRMFLLRGQTPVSKKDTLCDPDGKEHKDTILTTATHPETNETIALAILPVTITEQSNEVQVNSKKDAVLKAEPLNYTTT